MRWRYGKTVVEVMGQWIQTTLPDGQQVAAVPQHGAEDVARAHSLGYAGNVDLMTLDHDRLHALLCDAIGLPESYVLRASALSAGPSELTGAEEEAVLALQRFVNLARAAGLEF